MAQRLTQCMPPSPPWLRPPVHSSIRALCGGQVLPLHSVVPALCRVLEHPDPGLRSGGFALANALRRMHGDEAVRE